MARITLKGRSSDQVRSVLSMLSSTLTVTLRRLTGKAIPGWSWNTEVGIHFLRAQMTHAFQLTPAGGGRDYLDSLVLPPPSPYQVNIQPTGPGEPTGRWFTPHRLQSSGTLLYLHGGGYAFYADTHQSMIAYIAQAAGLRTLALDYRLTPEHPHPAQIEDALSAYRWLLESGVKPGELLISGDSAGGHLALMLLLALPKAGLPQPAAALPLCAWTDIGPRGQSLHGNDPYDWVQGDMALQFGRWYRGGTNLPDEELSPIYGDFHGLAPLYMQAGGREILLNMIHDFAQMARDQGAEVTLDVWNAMPHDFQAFGDSLPDSRAALARIGQVTAHYLTPPEDRGTLPTTSNTVIRSTAPAR